MESAVVGPVHTVQSVHITLEPTAARAKSTTGKKSLCPQLTSSGIMRIRYESGTAVPEDNIPVSFVNHGQHRDVYFGFSVRLGRLALKIQPRYDAVTNEMN